RLPARRATSAPEFGGEAHAEDPFLAGAPEEVPLELRVPPGEIGAVLSSPGASWRQFDLEEITHPGTERREVGRQAEVGERVHVVALVSASGGVRDRVARSGCAGSRWCLRRSW